MCRGSAREASLEMPLGPFVRLERGAGAAPGISKEEPCGRGVPALRGAVGSASLWDWGLWGRGSLLWVEGFSIPPSMSG